MTVTADPIHIRSPHRIQPFLCCIALLMLLGSGGTVRAQSAEEIENRLTQIRQTIQQLTEQRNADLRQHDQLLAQLRDADRELGRIGLNISQIDQTIIDSRARLSSLEEQQQQQTQQIEQQRQALAQQLRAAYAMGKQQHLKLWFNQKDVTRLGRSLTYYQYLSKARLETISRFTEQLQRLASLNQQVQDEQAMLNRQRSELATQQSQQQMARDKQQQLAQTLLQRAEQSGSQLTSLGQEQNELQELLKRLGDIFADIPKELSSATLSSAKGRLSWPVSGSFAIAPGVQKSGGMDTLGALISTSSGQPVQAVFHGRIAYADWFRGFGLLTIVDHGDGYMSLYGFNEALLKEVGDWVQTGELIAYAGASGALQRPGVYFELRHDSRPIRLNGWFSSSRP